MAERNPKREAEKRKHLAPKQVLNKRQLQIWRRMLTLIDELCARMAAAKLIDELGVWMAAARLIDE